MEETTLQTRKGHYTDTCYIGYVDDGYRPFMTVMDYIYFLEKREENKKDGRYLLK